MIEKVQSFFATKPMTVCLALTFLIGVAGLIVELVFGENFFGRSGSLIVMVALALGARDLGKRPIAETVGIDRYEKSASLLREAQEQGPNANGFLLVRERFQMMDAVAAARQRRLRAEAVMASIGTFIWGFGDLLLRSPQS